MSDTEMELKVMCQWIVEKLEALASGKLYDEETGEFVDDEGQQGSFTELDDNRYTDLYNYIADNLGIRITTSLEGSEYYGAEICVAWGGPNIYIETSDSYVRGYWGSDRAEVPLSYSARDKIDDIIDEWRQCY